MLAFLLSRIMFPRIRRCLSLCVPVPPRCIQILRAVAPDAISMRSQYCHRRHIYTVIKMLIVIVMITEILAESFLLLLTPPDLTMTSPPFPLPAFKKQ